MSTIKPIVVEQTFDAPVNRLWSALTEVDQMTRWFFNNIPDFKPEVGFFTEFNVNSGERDFLHQWRVIHAVPCSSIAYSWEYGGYPGTSTATFELWENGPGSKVRLSHAGTHTFPQDVPEFTRESCSGGWRYFICENLKGYLDGSSGR